MSIPIKKSKELQELMTLAQQKIDAADKQSTQNSTEKNRLATYDLVIQKREDAVVSRERNGKARADDLDKKEDIIKSREVELGVEADISMRMREEAKKEGVSAKENFAKSKETLKDAKEKELEVAYQVLELGKRDEDLTKREEKHRIVVKEFTIKDKNVEIKAKELKLQDKEEKFL